MTFQTFTVALGAAKFPFVSDFLQRTVIIPGLDAPPRLPKNVSGESESANYEIAKFFYCQNVLPTADGLRSVGYAQQVPALVGTSDFDQVITLRDFDENNFLLSPARGKNYIYRQDVGEWVSTNPFGGWTGDLVTRGYVNGRTFVCYEGYDVFEYDEGANTFLPVAITGLTASDIDGISASQNYLIAWSGITIYWSSLIDPTDFTPSILTGSGSSIPQDVKGTIRAIVPIAGGFVVYTTKNAVVALYTNNSRAPFVFREISNAGGVQSPEQVSIEASAGYHYAWTTNGLQKVSTTVAEHVTDAEVTDFLAGRILETFDLPTLTLTTERLFANLLVKLSYISGRFLVISYGKTATPYTHAIVYDFDLGRWGKLQINHVDAFQYPYPNLIGQVTDTPPKQSIAFIQQDGTILLLVMDYRIAEQVGVLYLGKFQLVRQRTVTFQTLEVENLIQAYPPNVYMLLSYNGKTLADPAQLQLLVDDSIYQKFGAPLPNGIVGAPRTGKSISFLITGTFELNAVMPTLTTHGNR